MPRKTKKQRTTNTEAKLAELVKILKRKPDATLADLNKNRRGKKRFGPRTLGKARTLAGITATAAKTKTANRRGRQKANNRTPNDTLARLRAEIDRHRRIISVLEAAETELAAEA